MQCDPAGFHLCSHYKDKETEGFWTDCPDCDTCNSYCPIVPGYTWNGFPPNDSPLPNCMMYKARIQTGTFS